MWCAVLNSSHNIVVVFSLNCRPTPSEKIKLIFQLLIITFCLYYLTVQEVDFFNSHIMGPTIDISVVTVFTRITSQPLLALFWLLCQNNTCRVFKNNISADI